MAIFVKVLRIQTTDPRSEISPYDRCDGSARRTVRRREGCRPARRAPGGAGTREARRTATAGARRNRAIQRCSGRRSAPARSGSQSRRRRAIRTGRTRRRRPRRGRRSRAIFLSVRTQSEASCLEDDDPSVAKSQRRRDSNPCVSLERASPQPTVARTQVAGAIFRCHLRSCDPNFSSQAISALKGS